jgi:hypothetical protein
LRAHQMLFGNKWQWSRIELPWATRGERHASTDFMGRPCRDLRGRRGLFLGSCDALSCRLYPRGRPEPANRPGFLSANSGCLTPGAGSPQKGVPPRPIRCYFFPVLYPSI